MEILPQLLISGQQKISVAPLREIPFCRKKAGWVISAVFGQWYSGILRLLVCDDREPQYCSMLP
ncbi:MAG: hypothetical protein RL220_1320 [Bacteroidota bacterium]